jgi:hypothetical protein
VGTIVPMAVVLTLMLIPGGALAAGAHHRKKTHAATKSHKHKSHKKKKKKTTSPTPAPTPAPATPTVREIPVTFSVVNTNTSQVPCGTDGKQYTIAGTLILPPSTTPAGVTLYAHGLGFGAWFWNFTAVPGYDYATSEANLGHASAVIDRLGYGASSIPSGAASCVGGQASILHQIVQDLRSGAYGAGGGAAPIGFSRVGLAGHSAGGELAEIEAYSFRDINALAVMDWADQSYSPGALTAFGEDGAQCVTGGTTQVGGQGSDYASYGQSAAGFDALMFANAAPNVEAAATAMRTNDPCGDILSILNAVAVDALNIGTIKVPVAYVWGTQDANYIIGTPWWSLQELLYSESPKVTDITLPGSGHAVTLERTFPTLVSQMSAWLTANGL